MKKIVMLPAGIDACALYRLYMPHLRMAGTKFVFNPKFRLPVEELVDAQIAVVQRLASRENYAAIEKMKQIGLKVVYDLDDALWSLPSYNPGKAQFTAIKKNFPILMKMCDMVTVSTPPLRASVISNVKIKKPVRVIHNAIDFDLFYPLPKIETEKVKVGWVGTATHDKDTDEMFYMLPELLDKNDKMIFETVGSKLPEKLINHPKVKQNHFVPIAEYPSRLSSWRFDLLLAPLQNNAFNTSKSNIKILEAAAMKTPILVSPVAPYTSFCALDERLKYLVCHTAQQWKDKIAGFVNDPGRRFFYGELLYSTAKEYFDVANMANKWMEAFNELC